VSGPNLSAAVESDGDAVASDSKPPLTVVETEQPAIAASIELSLSPASTPDRSEAMPEFGTASASAVTTLDPAVAALCAPISNTNPCGPDLDLEGDAEYLNFLAASEGILPTLFFSTDDGKPFDRSTVDLHGQIAAIKPLWDRSRDLRLLVMRARLLILDRDLAGFATTLAAIAEWLDGFWEVVHPRAENGDLDARIAAIGALDLPTVVFPLQYTPLFEARRLGAVTYRAWLVAVGEVKPRGGEQKYPTASLSEARSDADPAVLAATRSHMMMLKASLGRIRGSFMLRGSSAGLETLAALVDKILAFVDPRAAEDTTADTMAAGSDEVGKDDVPVASASVSPLSLADAKEALAAIADYYNRSEPSSPTLPLVLQAHMLIGKSFFEVMSVLVPTQMEKAAFQIGADQFFELPVGKLPKAEVAPGNGSGQPTSAQDASKYRIQSRPQAIALLEQIQRFFRSSEPSSPVPMLCDRARALAERDFMSVLKEVLPKAALKNFGAEK
jgi:type VI secretion system protein ImpA